MPEREVTMNGIILAVVIVVACRAVKVITRRILKKLENTNDNGFKGAIGA